jgi:tetratricopeptide (TPR) repeat protein
MNRRAKLILAVIFALTAITTRDGLAQTRAKQTAETHYEKGMKAYTLGHFPEAIEEFEKAYEMRSEPIFLYNIAQSHRQNNAPQRAIFFYRRYLEADPNVKNRPEIEKRIKDMETQLNAQKEKERAGATMTPAPPTAAQPTTPPPATAPQPVPTAPPVAPAPAATDQITQPAPVESAQQGRGLRIAGMATAGAGVAAVVVGIVFGVHASSLHDQAYPAPPLGYNYSKDQDSKSYRTLEWVSFGVGGAAVVTGGVLYYLGLSAKNAPVAIAPIFAPGAGGAAVFGRF